MVRLQPKLFTIKKLYAKSGNQCAFPRCSQQLFSDDNSQNISNICHIEAAEAGGQRYNHSGHDVQKYDEYARNYENLILLCPTHHKMTDDVNKYCVKDLKEMKVKHEQEITQTTIDKEPNIIWEAINAIATADFDQEYSQENQESFSIQNKIKHNFICKWEPSITEYKIYQAKIDSIYSRLEQSGESFKKHKLLQLIRNIYLNILGEYQTKTGEERIQVIENYADNIIDDVEQKLAELARGRNDNNIIAIPIIIVDAFMRCKILEKPDCEQP